MTSVRRFRFLVLAFIVGTLAFPAGAEAASLAVFKGKYGGKFTGVVVEASGETGRAVADAGTTVKASAKSAKFVITGTMSGVGYSQTITLAKGRATFSSLIPGGSGSLASSAKGTYKLHGKSATVTVKNPGGVQGKLVLKIGFTTGGSTLILSTVITYPNSDAVYSTVVGA